MPKLNLVNDPTVDGHLQTLFEEIKRTSGMPFVPNIMRVNANSTAAAWGVFECGKKLMLEGKLEPALKQLVFVAISAARECAYCEGAHMAWCRMLGVDEETIAKVAAEAEEPSISPPLAREAIRFAVKCALRPREVDEADFAALRAHGLSDEQIMELIAFAGMCVFNNVIADVTSIPLDDAFRSPR
jgi:uncharacterized peroxidase-related enzyme